MTKGIYQDTYSAKMNSQGGIQCSKDNAYWDEVVQAIEIDVQAHTDKWGAVCFSKDGTKFLQTGSLQNQFRLKINGEDVQDYVVVCGKSNSCDVTGTLEKPSYLVLWSRFGTVTKYKRGKSDWTIR